jgi:ligand-binding SRPBCC domain-containing protein
LLKPDVYTMRTWQWLPLPRDQVFAFFADAFNLERITPDLLGFRVITPAPIEMRPGTLIDYRLSLRGLPMRWRSEITEWQPPVRFADTQRRGPYREWFHRHEFEERDGGTFVTDVVRYRLIGPGIVTRIINKLLVQPDVHRIFTYRHAALERAFGLEGKTKSGQVSIERGHL